MNKRELVLKGFTFQNLIKCVNIYDLNMLKYIQGIDAKCNIIKYRQIISSFSYTKFNLRFSSVNFNEINI